jgi:formate-dependent phosphoribosylglycinamide formyltransferase (GAR transformylase)
MPAKTLLVLGASIYQEAAIVRARELGYRVLSTDNVPDNPGHARAESSFNVDITDREGILALARRERIDGILAPCTDVGVPTVAYVAEKLGLAGPPLAAAETATNKIRFREFQRRSDEPHPEFFLDAQWRPGTWIIKPEASSGSKGVSIARNADELRARLPEARAFSRSGRAIVERCIDGHQGTCEGILKDGRIATAWLLDRQTAAPPHVATHGHYVPTSLDAHVQAAVLERIAAVWSKLGVREGLFDCDFVVGHDAVYVLELSPRLGGNSIAGLLSFAASFDALEYVIRFACGDAPAPPPQRAPKVAAMVLLGVNAAGRLRYDEPAAARLRTEPWLARLAIDLPAGAPVEPFINGRHRVGEAIVAATDRRTLERRVDELKARLAMGAA